ncbi:subtilisin-like protein [Hypomontagnella monticulosa]|nr:subtilisin-like protein [Hypomontagnella monticulosa]
MNMPSQYIASLTSYLLPAWIFACLATSKNPGVSSRSSYSLKERHHVPHNWAYVGRAPADHRIELQIGLRQSRFNELEQRLLEVSSPSHPRYGKHLSAEEVHTLVKPDDESVALTIEWLEENGIGTDILDLSPSQDWISITLPINHIERLLSTEYHSFQYEDSDEDYSVLRASEWSLPEHLHEHIDCIQPTSSFFGVQAAAQKERSYWDTIVENINKDERSPASEGVEPHIPRASSVRQVCNASEVTPTCLRTLYGTIDYEIQVPDKNSMSLTNYLGQFNNRSDTSLFLSHYRPDIPVDAWDFTDISVAGGLNPQTPADAYQLEHGKGKEGNLDIQAMLGIAYPTPLTIYSTLGTPPPFKPTAFAPNNTNEPYLIWLQYMLALPDSQLPKVISTSYGDIEHTLPPAYARRVCNSFAQLGARGVSLIFGSGDSGVGRDGMCHTNHNDGRPETPEFLVSFPDACPYVTSVGATMGMDPEQVAVLDEKKFVSGGGFSNYFARPPWQDGPAQAYIASLGDEHRGMYNAEGAAYPDVSAQGYEYAVYWNGTKRLMSGTSASAPTFAAIIALVNDALLAEGKPALGFLNPWIWEVGKKGAGFTDVTVGNSKGCNGSGYPTRTGWDAASGWGTPWFPALKELALGNHVKSGKPWYIL